MTDRQAQARGAQVRKGGTGTTGVYDGNSRKAVSDEQTGEAKENEREQTFRFLKTYTVFNVAQIDGLPEHFHIVPEPAPEEERIKTAEAFFAAVPARVRNGHDRAFYAPGPDRIPLPPFSPFHDTSEERRLGTEGVRTS